MDDVALGTACRAVRIRKRLTQAQLAEAAHVKRRDVSFLERGMVDRLPLSAMRRMAAILEMRLEIKPHFRGPELDRLVNAAHAALQSAVLRRFDALPGWVAVPEVTYSIYGERGAVDILAWHAATRTLLIVELKTVLVDAAEIVRKMDERIRLAPAVGGRRGWRPLAVASWLVFTDTRTNRSHLARQRAILERFARLDGRRMRTWLREPRGPVAALSFWEERTAMVARRIGRPRDGGAGRSPAPTP
jgi:transcriptional regulator with XRE-family HTH domain